MNTFSSSSEGSSQFVDQIKQSKFLSHTKKQQPKQVRLKMTDAQKGAQIKARTNAESAQVKAGKSTSSVNNKAGQGQKSNTGLWISLLAGLAFGFAAVNAANEPQGCETEVAERRKEAFVRSLLLYQRDAPVILSLVSGVIRMRSSSTGRLSKALALIMAALLWKVSSLRLLDNLGVNKALFGMEMARGMEYYYRDGNQYISFIMQMDAPDSLEQLRDDMREHFKRFPRLNQRLV